MNLRKIKRKLIRNFNDYGIWICLGKIFSYIFADFYKREKWIFYKLDLADNITDPTDNYHFDFRLIREKDNFYIKSIEDMAEWLEGTIGPDLAAGKKLCMAVIDEGRLVAFYLAAFKRIILSLLSLEVTLKDDEAWGEEIMIDKAYRRKGLSLALKTRCFSELQKRGVKSLYVCINLNNTASLNSAAKLPIQKAFTVQFLKNLSSSNLTFSEISIDSLKQIREERADRRLIKLYDIIKESITTKPDYIIKPGKEDRKNIFRIKTSDLF